MGRKSRRLERRAEILQAFARILADHGYAGATMTAVADQAGVSPGLLHHHFANKAEMLDELLTYLISSFKVRLEKYPKGEDDLQRYLECALKLDLNSDTVAARCWVGILSEGIRDPSLFNKIKKHLESEIHEIERLSNGRIDKYQSSALLAYIFGALVFGAFAPRKTAGFASENGKLFAKALRD